MAPRGVDKSAQDKKKPTSRSARAGLQFPVGRVHRLLKVRAPPVNNGRQPPMAPPPSTASSPTWSTWTHLFGHME